MQCVFSALTLRVRPVLAHSCGSFPLLGGGRVHEEARIHPVLHGWALGLFPVFIYMCMCVCVCVYDAGVAMAGAFVQSLYPGCKTATELVIHVIHVPGSCQPGSLCACPCAHCLERSLTPWCGARSTSGTAVSKDMVPCGFNSCAVMEVERPVTFVGGLCVFLCEMPVLSFTKFPEWSVVLLLICRCLSHVLYAFAYPGPWLVAHVVSLFFVFVQPLWRLSPQPSFFFFLKLFR